MMQVHNNVHACTHHIIFKLWHINLNTHMITINIREHVPTATRDQVPSASTQYIIETTANHTVVERVDVYSGNKHAIESQ